MGTTALSPVTNQLRIASTALAGGLAAIASPTLQAVSAVLGGAGVSSTGTAAQSFSDLIDGAIANNGSVNSLARVTQLTQLLNGTPLLSLFTALLQTFGGRLPV